jgi:hypothetical protein
VSDDCAAAVERFLDDVDGALREYDRGYVDADATLGVIRGHLSDLAAATE